MKVVVLCGGLGTRLAEETEVRPKPMVEIGGRPILWHIMKHYSHFGFKEFVVALGYKGEVIKRYFLDYCSLSADMTLRSADGQIEKHDTRGRGLDRSPGGHGPGHDDRRTVETGPARGSDRGVHAHLR